MHLRAGQRRSADEDVHGDRDYLGARVHLDIDRNVFYPALRAGDEDYTARRCLADHEHISQLLDEIEHAGPTEDAFFAKIHLLCELFREHVQAEEKPRGVFAFGSARYAAPGMVTPPEVSVAR